MKIYAYEVREDEKEYFEELSISLQEQSDTITSISDMRAKSDCMCVMHTMIPTG